MQAPEPVEVHAVKAQVHALLLALAPGDQRPRVGGPDRKAPGGRKVLAVGKPEVEVAVGGRHDDLVQRRLEGLRLRIDSHDDVAPLERHAHGHVRRANTFGSERREPDDRYERRQRRENNRRRRDRKWPPARRPQCPTRARPRGRRPRGD